MRRYKDKNSERGRGLFDRVFRPVLRAGAYFLLPWACAAFLGGCGEQYRYAL